MVFSQSLLLLCLIILFCTKRDLLPLPKITDPDYFLPFVQAIEAGRILISGRTRPMLIRGICKQTGVKGEYVVKLKGSPEMYPDACMNELIGSFLAAELNLNVPDPATVEISPELVETMEEHGNYELANQSLGPNFGSFYKEGYLEIIPGQNISTDLKEKLYDIFAFDILVGNPDRRIDKPNFLSNGKDFLIYDHELAFSFTQILSFARNPQPWLIPLTEMSWISRNYCFAQLKGKHSDFSNFAARLEGLNENFWARADELIPPEWKTNNYLVIKAHINLIVANRHKFIQELNRILSP